MGRLHHHLISMTRRRFHALPGAFNFAAHTVTLGGDEARHLRDVLRLKEGDEVYVFDGQGREFRCAVLSTKRDSAELRIEALQSREVDEGEPLGSQLPGFDPA